MSKAYVPLVEYIFTLELKVSFNTEVIDVPGLCKKVNQLAKGYGLPERLKLPRAKAIFKTLNLQEVVSTPQSVSTDVNPDIIKDILDRLSRLEDSISPAKDKVDEYLQQNWGPLFTEEVQQDAVNEDPLYRCLLKSSEEFINLTKNFEFFITSVQERFNQSKTALKNKVYLPKANAWAAILQHVMISDYALTEGLVAEEVSVDLKNQFFRGMQELRSRRTSFYPVEYYLSEFPNYGSVILSPILSSLARKDYFPIPKRFWVPNDKVLDNFGYPVFASKV